MSRSAHPPQPAAAEPTSPQQNILLAGCGDLGFAVGTRLLEAGHRVTGARRRPASAPFEMIAIDLADPGRGRLPHSDAVVVALSADRSDADSYERAYRKTLHGLAQALPAMPDRVVLVSSTSVLGDHHGETVTEDTTPTPTRETAKVLLAAEHDARALFDEVVVLRPAGIYGPGRTSTINRVLQGHPADHARMTNRIHRDDLVTAIAAVLHAQKPPRLIHGVDTEPAPMGAVLEYLAQQLGVAVPPDNGSGQAQGKIVDGSLLHQLLGPDALRFPTFREGYASLLASR